MVATQDIGLDKVLDRLAEEAGNLASAAARAEMGLQAVLDRVTGLPPGAGADLQRVDHLRQSLEDFTRVLWLAAEAAAEPVSATLPTATLREAIILSDLRNQILGQAPPSATARDDVGMDDLHLF